MGLLFSTVPAASRGYVTPIWETGKRHKAEAHSFQPGTNILHRGTIFTHMLHRALNCPNNLPTVIINLTSSFGIYSVIQHYFKVNGSDIQNSEII